MNYFTKAATYMLNELPIQTALFLGLPAYCATAGGTTHIINNTDSDLVKIAGIGALTLETIAVCLLTKVCCDKEDQRIS